MNLSKGMEFILTIYPNASNLSKGGCIAARNRGEMHGITGKGGAYQIIRASLCYAIIVP